MSPISNIIILPTPPYTHYVVVVCELSFVENYDIC